MKVSRYISALLAALLCCTACIRENIDDCETPVEVRFLYWGNGIVDIFSDRVDSVLMFIYEMPSGDLYRTESIPAQELEAFQGAKLRLFPGDYRIVCWGNAGEGSYIDSEAGMIMPVEHHDPQSGERSSGLEELYYGSLEISVPQTLRPVLDTIVYESSYIQMNVEFIGFGAIGHGNVDESGAVSGSDEQEPVIQYLHSSHSSYIDFDNVPSDDVADYEPVLTVHEDYEDSYKTTYLVPKFDNSTESVLDIYRKDNGESVYSRPLAEILRELDIEIDPDLQEQQVSLRLVATVEDGYIVNVEVIGWNTVIVFPDL